MKNFCLTLVLFSGFIFHAQAQFLVGGHLAPAFPLGEFSDVADLGFGLGGEVKYLFNENVAFGFDISWYSFGTDFDDVNVNVTPFLLSAEYLIPQTSGFTPYVGLGLGFYRIASKFEGFGINATTSFTDFGIAPTIGALYPLNDQIDINTNLKFNFVFSDDITRTFFPLNVGVLVRLP